jgi:predicted secreted protein
VINNVQVKEEIDPRVLSKINDNFNVGFEPFTSDMSSSSSSASSTISNEDI